MPSLRTSTGALTTTVDAAVGAATAAVGTVGAMFAVALLIGFGLLARRSRTARGTRAAGGRADDLPQRANIALVRLDDDVAATQDELGFAVAQFGDAKAARIAAALESARRSLTESFALRQQLDDSVPDSGTQVREWNGRILMLCEAARKSLAAERAVFDALRELERSAPADLARVRRDADSARARLPASIARLESMTARFSPVAVASVAGNSTAATGELDAADRAVARAAQALSQCAAGAVPAVSAAGTPVSALIAEAEGGVRQASMLLEAIDTRAAAFEASAARLLALARTSRTELDRAKEVRDNPPDAGTGTAVTGAIEALSLSLADSDAAYDPDAAIAAIDARRDALDTALAGARNEIQRLTHARQALGGALLAARSQIDTTSTYIAGRRGRTGPQARTRLAEAERLLELARSEADPVTALDLARSSATHSRDADALARYDLMH